MALFGFNTKLAVLNNTLTGFAKGGIYENFVAEALIKKGYTLHCFNIGSITSPNSIINGQKLYQFL